MDNSEQAFGHGKLFSVLHVHLSKNMQQTSWTICAFSWLAVKELASDYHFYGDIYIYI